MPFKKTSDNPNHVQKIKVEKMVNYTFCRCERGVYACGFDKVTPKMTPFY